MSYGVGCRSCGETCHPNRMCDECGSDRHVSIAGRFDCISYDSRRASKVLYAGFPMRFCEDCTCIWGFWSFIPLWFGFNGMLMFYSGSYWRALWAFLKGE